MSFENDDKRFQQARQEILQRSGIDVPPPTPPMSPIPPREHVPYVPKNAAILASTRRTSAKLSREDQARLLRQVAERNHALNWQDRSDHTMKQRKLDLILGQERGYENPMLASDRQLSLLSAEEQYIAVTSQATTGTETSKDIHISKALWYITPVIIVGGIGLVCNLLNTP